MVCLGFEPGTAAWKGKMTGPLNRLLVPLVYN